MKCFYTVFWSEVVILSFGGTFWTADGENVTWYEPPPEETLSDHNLDHKLKTVRLLEGVTDSPLSWNFSFSSDLTFDGLTVNFNGVNVAGVRSSGQAGLVNPSDQRYSFSWTATEKFTLIISNVTDADSGMFTCLVDFCLGFACNDWGSTIKVEVVEPPSITNISMNQTVIVCKDVTTLNLYCIAVGKPAPNVTWIKVSDNRSVTFPLNISGEGDEGTYRCTADNGVGNSVTRDVFITVLECPELTFVSRDPVVCEDSTVTLSCNATGKPTPNITWTRVTVNGTTDSAPLHPVVDGTFLISNINRSSNGSTYRCTATNGVGYPVNRTVTVTVRHSAAVDRIDTSSKLVIEDDSFNMTCVTSGDPEPNVYWIKVNNSARINGSVLNFTNINRNDSGLYRCEAENRCGNGSRFHFIDVLYPPAITHISRAKNFSFVLDQNETITLNCSAIGNPSPNVTWEKDNLVVTFPLNITGKHDEGNYTCVASNDVGDSATETVSVIIDKYHPFNTILTSSKNPVVVNSTFNLSCTAQANPPAKYIFYRGQEILNISQNDESVAVLETSVGERIDKVNYRCTPSNDYGYGKTDEELVTVNYRPRVFITQSPKLVFEGNGTILFCNATGNPPPNITWTKSGNDSVLSSSEKLNLTNLRRDDNRAVYKCRVQNYLGSEEDSATITVFFPPNVTIEQCPTSVNEDDNVTLRCTATGSPDPSTAWIREMPLSVSSYRETLNLTAIKRDQSGLYKCIAWNDVGNNSTKNCTIDVYYRPSFSNLSVVPSNTTVLRGSNVSLNCSTDANPAAYLYQFYFNDSFFIGNSSSGVFNITVDTDGVYTCVPINEVGKRDNATVEITAVVAASVEINGTTYLAVERKNITLFCQASGKPEPTVTWTRVGSSDILSNTSVLTLVNVSRPGTPDNMIQYQCTASNGVGNPATAVANLNVTYPPVIINNQSVVNITRTENKTLNCEVQGNPRPGFIWINDSSGHVLSYESVLEFINAEDFDTGSYSCNVTSPLGFDSSTIVIRVTRDAIPVDLTVSEEYQSEYADLNNAKTKAFLKPLQDEVVKRFAKNPNFGNAEVIGVRSGSVIVSFVLKFTTPVTLDEGLKDLRSVEGKKIGPYTVTSLAVVDEESPTAGTSGSTNAPVTTAKKTTQRGLEDRPPWAIIGGTIGAAVVVIIVLLVAWWVHKKRKCVKDTKIHNSESEVLNGQNDIEDGSHARVNGGYNGHYADSGPPSANGSNKFVQPQLQPAQQQQQQQEAAAPPAHAEVDKSKKKNRDKKNGNENIPDYAVVDKSKKKKKNPEVEDPYAEVEDPKKDKKTADPATHDYAVVNKSKKKKKEEDENAYATVDKSKKSKKGQQKPKAPGEVLYADLGDFQPVQPLPTVSTSPEPLAPIKRPTPYEGTEYADITQFLKGNATLPEGQSTEMQPTYANAGGGQGAAANKENANTGGKGGGGDTEPKETPM